MLMLGANLELSSLSLRHHNPSVIYSRSGYALLMNRTTTESVATTTISQQAIESAAQISRLTISVSDNGSELFRPGFSKHVNEGI